MREEEGRGGKRKGEEGRGGKRKGEEGRGGKSREEEGRGGERREEEGRGRERRGEEKKGHFDPRMIRRALTAQVPGKAGREALRRHDRHVSRPDLPASS